MIFKSQFFLCLFSVGFKNYSKFIYPTIKFIGYFEIFLYFNFSSDDFESQNKDSILFNQILSLNSHLCQNKPFKIF